MIAFEVHLNGEKLCTAGIGDLGVLTAMLDWTRVRKIVTKDTPESLTLWVTGMNSSTAEFPRWLNRPVSVGDEIRIRIVNTESIDEPVHKGVLAGGPQEIEKHAFRMQ